MIHDSEFALHSDRSAWIGIGFVDEGHAVLDSIYITDGIFNITSLARPGIDADRATNSGDAAQVTVHTIQIAGSMFAIESRSIPDSPQTAGFQQLIRC
jgi:hypothetical protein